MKILFLIVFMINFLGCAQDKDTEMTVNELIEAMEKNPDLLILDVRTPPELEASLGHINGVVNIPVQELGSRMKEMEKFKDKDIAVICRTGNRSGTATRMLRSNGYDAKNVLGGMVEYRKVLK